MNGLSYIIYGMIQERSYFTVRELVERLLDDRYGIKNLSHVKGELPPEVSRVKHSLSIQIGHILQYFLTQGLIEKYSKIAWKVVNHES